MKKNISIVILSILVLIGLLGWKNYHDVSIYSEDIISRYEGQAYRSVSQGIGVYDEQEEFEIRLDRIITDFARVEASIYTRYGINVASNGEKEELQKKMEFYRYVGEELIGMRYNVNKDTAAYIDYEGELKQLRSLMQDLGMADTEEWGSVLDKYVKEHPDNRLFFNQ